MKKKKLLSNNRDWGKGFACQGRTKVCSKVRTKSRVRY